MRRVSTHGLIAAEAGLVRALVKLMGCSGNAHPVWEYVAQGPCEALVADASVTDLNEVRHARGCRSVLLLGSAVRDADCEAVARPLQAAQFEQWLHRVQALPGPAVTQSGAAIAPRYKLRRWPPTAIIHGEAAHLRMASHLSRRHMSVPELARLAHQDESRAQAFVQSLQGMQLLDDGSVACLAGHGAAALPGAANMGLIRSIRQRLAL